ncbi:MAG: ATP12 family chaperone protein [Roseicyclus sp.]
MTEWVARRFWTEVDVAGGPGAWRVLLDGRPVRTPGRAPLDLPSAAMARAMAGEWAAQDRVIDPRTMPVTRSANSAIDRVVPQKAEVVAMLASYGETDLLCHRAEGPEALVALQSEGWDPILDWAAERLGARLRPTTGILPAEQPPEALARLSERLAAFDAFGLTAVHDLVTLSGSLVLGLAVAEGRVDAETGWALSRIDEDWQIAQWGEDEEAAEAAARKFADFRHALRFFKLASEP